MREAFRKFSEQTSAAVGSSWMFVLAALVIVVWALTGPIFNFSNTWQLVINTGTTIVTFLMVFLIQNTQNRDSRAIHLKLDELLRGVQGARTGMVDVESMTDEELDTLHDEFRELHQQLEAEVKERNEEMAAAAGERAGAEAGKVVAEQVSQQAKTEARQSAEEVVEKRAGEVAGSQRG